MKKPFEFMVLKLLCLPFVWFYKTIKNRIKRTKAYFLYSFSRKLPYKDRSKHVYITGQTGSGKSELLKLMIYSQLSRKRKETIVLIDPHGDLAEEVVRLRICKSEDIYYFDPSLSQDYFPSIGPFDTKHINKDGEAYERSIEILSRELSDVFREILRDSPSLTLQMKTLLVPCIETLLRFGNANLGILQTFMDERNNRKLYDIACKSPNHSHAQFFKNGFKNPIFSLTKQSLYTKIQSLLNSRFMKRMILASKPGYSLDDIIDKHRLVVFNLSKGKIGPEASEVFGRFIMAVIKSYALKRASVEKKERFPVYLYIDEFQNYVSPSIVEILSETRKYGLHIVFANQTFGQNMTDEMQHVVLNNTGVKICGSNGLHTQQIFAKEMHLGIEYLQRLKTGEFYVKTGSKNPFKFEAPSFLIAKKNQYISGHEWEERKQIFLGSYFTSDIEKLIDLYNTQFEEAENKKESAVASQADAGVDKVGKLSGQIHEKFEFILPAPDTDSVQSTNQIESASYEVSTVIYSDAQVKILESLATYRYLTVKQFVALGIRKHRANLYGLVKDLLGRQKAPLQKITFPPVPGYGKLEDIFYLTGEGARIIKEFGNCDDVKFISGNIPHFSRDYFHRIGTIDCHILLRAWAISNEVKIGNFDMYFDYVPGKKQSSWESKNRIKAATGNDANLVIIPDAVFSLFTEKKLYFLEYTNHNELAKIMNQMKNHCLLFGNAAIQEKYGFSGKHTVLFVFQTVGVKEEICRRMITDEQLRTHYGSFLMKSKDEPCFASFGTGWTICTGELKDIS